MDQRISVADDLRFWIDKLEEVQMSLVTVHFTISKCRAKTKKLQHGELAGFKMFGNKIVK